ncbi:MAG: hypothetical protein HPY53_09330 [Brevinematales bacterium]|nr:hypothetical protein [Brevinematales bacterium]
MGKIFIFMLSAVLTASCGQSGAAVIKSGWIMNDITGSGAVQMDDGKIAPEYDTPSPDASKLPVEFGPFFLPIGNDMQSVTLNYFTASPKKTVVFFSMVGDIDWVRKDNNLSAFHQMAFQQLEESAVYRFELQTESQTLQKISSIKTVPYGNVFQFTFGITKITDQKIEAQNAPNFMILMSDKDSMSAGEFEQFYRNNSALLSSTIIIPAFALHYDGKNISPGKDGYYYIEYRNTHIVIISREYDGYGWIAKFMSDQPNHKNFIVIGNLSKESTAKITQAYYSKAQGIFTLQKTGIPGTEAVEGYKWFVIENGPNTGAIAPKAGKSDGW